MIPGTFILFYFDPLKICSAKRLCALEVPLIPRESHTFRSNQSLRKEYENHCLIYTFENDSMEINDMAVLFQKCFFLDID
ncbi:hypothetical protein BSG1_19425 [Bacillus sp. SG-1]|nr:hypothetical protein BSG1_19425 [Bacillus sp. SG-1]